ncbi:MAG: ATP-dependent DNA helicase RecG [Armatimonadota bacterium]
MAIIPAKGAVAPKKGPSSVSTYKTLDSPVQFVKGVGERMSRVLGKLGIFNVRDLIYHFPRRHEDRSHLARIGSLRGGEEVTIAGQIIASDNVRPRGGLVLTKVAINDGSGVATLTWFNQHYLKDRFLKMRGKEIIVYGTAQVGRWGIEIQSPEWEELKEDEGPLSSKRIVPVYPLTEGLFQGTMRKIVSNALDGYLKLVPEVLPEKLRDRLDLMDIADAIRNMHFPEGKEALEAARKRLVFEELFMLQLALALRKREIDTPGAGISFKIPENLREMLHSALPFELTGAQKKVIREISESMARPDCMNRLLQGDVGSGKTAVAMAAILIAAANGYQSALMAPTEILAEQHYLGLSQMLSALHVKVDLLTGSVTAKKKREAYERIASGETNLAIGTHAVIQENVEFSRLGLVIIDEQHRFGVLQRAALRDKGLNPDVLVMTATPIPRTLTLTVYGDLEISIIDELPPGRKPIRTHWKQIDERDRVYAGVRKLVSEGRQAYIVCPLVEESEKLQAKAATEIYKHLANDVFSDLRVGLLHGQMKTADKDTVMSAFRAGEIDVLVATTVIEVGVDVPNATVMVIEDAHRFGLAQLHQLRGRVGRGENQSFCVMVGDASNDDAAARLGVMTRTTDGFIISEEDLKIRGPGEFYGTRQSGIPALKVTDIFRDIPILELARKEAFEMIKIDPNLANPEIRALKSDMLKKYEDFQLATIS